MSEMKRPLLQLLLASLYHLRDKRWEFHIAQTPWKTAIIWFYSSGCPYLRDCRLADLAILTGNRYSAGFNLSMRDVHRKTVLVAQGWIDDFWLSSTSLSRRYVLMNQRWVWYLFPDSWAQLHLPLNTVRTLGKFIFCAPWFCDLRIKKK